MKLGKSTFRTKLYTMNLMQGQELCSRELNRMAKVSAELHYIITY